MIKRRFQHGRDGEGHLEPDAANESYRMLRAAPIGRWLTDDYLDQKGLDVDITYVEKAGAIPGVSNNPAGYCQEAPRGRRYHVWIVAGYVGQANEVSCPSGHRWLVPDNASMLARFPCPVCKKQSNPGMTWISKLVDRPAVEIARTTFHELLHAWWMTEYPTGTGHAKNIEPQVEAFGSTTYSPHGIEPAFLERLKKFDGQVR